MTAKILEYGLDPDGAFSVAWGGRGIYKGPVRPSRKGGKAPLQFDLPMNRQQFDGGSKADQKAFSAWLNKVGLPALHQRILDADLWRDEERDLAFELDGVEFRARARGGYLYVGAWKPAVTP